MIPKILKPKPHYHRRRRFPIHASAAGIASNTNCHRTYSSSRLFHHPRVMKQRSCQQHMLAPFSATSILSCNSGKIPSLSAAKFHTNPSHSSGHFHFLNVAQQQRRHYHMVFFGTDHFALETLKEIHEKCVLQKNNPQENSLLVIAPPNSTHQNKQVVHPVIQYAMDHDLVFVHVPHEKKWPRDLRDLREMFLEGGQRVVNSSEASGEEAVSQTTQSQASRAVSPNRATRKISPQDLPPHFDVGVVVSFRYLIPQFIVNEFQVGAFNIHPSALPKYRGPAPLAWTIAKGEQDTRISFIQLVSKFDHGAIAYQSEPIPIAPDEMYTSLYSRIAKTSAKLAAEFLNQHNKQELAPLLKLQHSTTTTTTNDTQQVAQKSFDQVMSHLKHEDPPFAPKVNLKKHCFVSFQQNSSEEIFNKWRAFSQHWKIYTHVNGKTLYLLKLRPLSLSEDSIEREEVEERFSKDALPGEVTFCKRRKKVYIQCNDGKPIMLEEMQFASKRKTDGAGFAAGLSLKNFRKVKLVEEAPSKQ